MSSTSILLTPGRRRASKSGLRGSTLWPGMAGMACSRLVPDVTKSLCCRSSRPGAMVGLICK